MPDFTKQQFEKALAKYGIKPVNMGPMGLMFDLGDGLKVGNMGNLSRRQQLAWLLRRQEREKLKKEWLEASKTLHAVEIERLKNLAAHEPHESTREAVQYAIEVLEHVRPWTFDGSKQPKLIRMVKA